MDTWIKIEGEYDIWPNAKEKAKHLISNHLRMVKRKKRFEEWVKKMRGQWKIKK